MPASACRRFLRGCRVDLPFAGAFFPPTLHTHNRLDRWELELSGWCHCCVYTYLTTALCIYASRYCDKSFLYAWLGCCCCAGWLTGWLSRKHAGRSCDRPDAIVVCTRRAGINTNRASRVLACMIDKMFACICLLAWVLEGNCEADVPFSWSTIECDTGLATSYEGSSSGCRGPILYSLGERYRTRCCFPSGRRRPGGCVAQ